MLAEPLCRGTSPTGRVAGLCHNAGVDVPPTKSDTPPDHTVIGLHIEPALLPGWFDAIVELAPHHVRRMAVEEHPEGWRIRVELPDAGVAAFKQALAERWEQFVAEERAAGRWSQG